VHIEALRVNIIGPRHDLRSAEQFRLGDAYHGGNGSPNKPLGHPKSFLAKLDDHPLSFGRSHILTPILAHGSERTAHDGCRIHSSQVGSLKK
jgi:hypothetical protein